MDNGTKIRMVAETLRNHLLTPSGGFSMTILDGAINQLHIIANEMTDKQEYVSNDGGITFVAKCSWCDVYGCTTDHFHEDFTPRTTDPKTPY